MKREDAWKQSTIPIGSPLYRRSRFRFDNRNHLAFCIDVLTGLTLAPVGCGQHYPDRAG